MFSTPCFGERVILVEYNYLFVTQNGSVDKVTWSAGTFPGLDHEKVEAIHASASAGATPKVVLASFGLHRT